VLGPGEENQGKARLVYPDRDVEVEKSTDEETKTKKPTGTTNHSGLLYEPFKRGRKHYGNGQGKKEKEQITLWLNALQGRKGQKKVLPRPENGIQPERKITSSRRAWGKLDVWDLEKNEKTTLGRS